MGKKAAGAFGLAVLIAALSGTKTPQKKPGRARGYYVVRKPLADNGLRDRISSVFGGRLFNSGQRPAEPVEASYTPPPANRNKPPQRSQPIGKDGLGPLFQIIGKAEAKSYDTIWGGINVADYPPKRLTQMTIGEVLDWQDSIDSRYQSEASGRYQFMEDTLRRIYKRAGLTRNDLFNAASQDKLAAVLINDAGLKRYRSGSITAEQFGDKLARVWAGLPVHSAQRGHRRHVNRGQSYYAGDSLNRATVSPESVLSAIKRI